MMARLPATIHFSPADIDNPAVNRHILSSRFLIRLEHLQNHFFIHRLLIQRGYDSHAELLVVSFEMVSLTLLFWTHVDRLPHIVRHLEWLVSSRVLQKHVQLLNAVQVMAYAAPSGGILCQELIRSGPATTAPGVKTPSRFAIIEKLFLLVGFLDWVTPNAPNSDLCISCKNVIRRVLEHVTQEPAPQAEGHFEPWNWDIGDTALDFEFGLLDTFEWMRPE